MAGALDRGRARPPRPEEERRGPPTPPPPVGGIWEFRWIAVRVRRRFPAVPRVGWPWLRAACVVGDKLEAKSNNITGGLFSVVHAHGYTRKPNTG